MSSATIIKDRFTCRHRGCRWGQLACGSSTSGPCFPGSCPCKRFNSIQLSPNWKLFLLILGSSFQQEDLVVRILGEPAQQRSCQNDESSNTTKKTCWYLPHLLASTHPALPAPITTCKWDHWKIARWELSWGDVCRISYLVVFFGLPGWAGHAPSSDLECCRGTLRAGRGGKISLLGWETSRTVHQQTLANVIFSKREDRKCWSLNSKQWMDGRRAGEQVESRLLTSGEQEAQVSMMIVKHLARLEDARPLRNLAQTPNDCNDFNPQICRDRKFYPLKPLTDIQTDPPCCYCHWVVVVALERTYQVDHWGHILKFNFHKR